MYLTNIFMNLLNIQEKMQEFSVWDEVIVTIANHSSFVAAVTQFSPVLSSSIVTMQISDKEDG